MNGDVVRGGGGERAEAGREVGQFNGGAGELEGADLLGDEAKMLRHEPRADDLATDGNAGDSGEDAGLPLLEMSRSFPLPKWAKSVPLLPELYTPATRLEAIQSPPIFTAP